MLLLGGFTIAAALSKYDIARRMAMFVLSKAGTKPQVVLLTNMFVSMFLSMWISNVASPVLCYSIIQVHSRFELVGSANVRLASPAESSARLEIRKSRCPGHRSSCQCRRSGVADRIAAEHHCTAEHASQR